MLSIKKTRISRLVRKVIKKVSPKKFYSFLFTSLIVILISLTLLVLYYSKDIIIFSLAKNLETKNNTLLHNAEEAFKNGFIENSAIYYQNYISTDPGVLNKIIAYKKLFEINVLTKQYNNALINLKEIELLDTKDMSVVINRIRLLLKTDQLKGADFELERASKRYRKSPEFIELNAIFYMKTKEYEKAIIEINKIKFRKRGFLTHKINVLCLIKQNDISGALLYLNKIESNVRTIEDKKKKSDFVLLKSTVMLLKGDITNIIEELRPSSQQGIMIDLSIRLIVYSYIYQDNLILLNSFISSLPDANFSDIRLLKAIGDYYHYKKEYEKAIDFYLMIADIRVYTRDELSALADMYYYNKDYSRSEYMLELLNEKYDFVTPIYFKNMSHLRVMQNDFSRGFMYLKQGALEYNQDTDFLLRLALINYDEKLFENALLYVEEGIRLAKILKTSDIRKFDVLKILISDSAQFRLAELDLLYMRNEVNADVNTYFRLMEYYLKNNRYHELLREFQTVDNFILNEKQKSIFLSYKLIYSLNMDDEYFLKQISDEIETDNNILPVYKVAFYIQKDRYKDALDLFQDNQELLKDNYLLAVAAYFNGDRAKSNMALSELLEKHPHHRKALYLKGVLNK